MSSGSVTTFMTAVNLFQAAAHDQKLPSGLVEREGAAGSMNSTPLPFRQPSRSKRAPLSPSRNRTYTAPSLYAAFEKSLSDDSQTENRSRAISSPETRSFSESFMQNRSLTTSTASKQCHASSPLRNLVEPGCILPGPARSTNPFELGSLRASTASGSPAWFCRHDKLVIFDGIQTQPKSGAKTFLCRTSKGLEVARKDCPKESVHVDLSCQHCKDMLGKGKWVYEAKVRRLSVCGSCRDRCLQEDEKQRVALAKKEVEMKGRRDSFLAESPPLPGAKLQLPESGSKDLRKIRSDCQLRGCDGPRQPNHHDIIPSSPSKEIRKSRSEMQLS